MVLRGAVDWVWSASGPPGGGRPRAHLPAMHGDWVVAGLLLLLLHGRDEVDHAFALGRDPNLGPAVKVELPHHPRLLLRPGQGLQGGKSVSGLSSLSHLAVLPTPPGRWGGGGFRPQSRAARGVLIWLASQMLAARRLWSP